MLADFLDTLELQRGQLQCVTRRLDARLQEHPGASLLMTIPGVGPRTAEAIPAYSDDVRRFRRSKQCAAYFGVTPRLDESGSRGGTGHISKQRPSVVRWLIVESAWRADWHSPGLRAFCEKVMYGQNQRNKIAVPATARELLTIKRAMLMTGESFNESLVSEQVVLAQRSRGCIA